MPSCEGPPLIVPIILCGGAGKRLWPASQAKTPKPMLPLAGGRSTFAMTLERIADPGLFAPPVIVAGAVHRYLVEAMLAEQRGEATLVLESAGRDTAPAVAAAMRLVPEDAVAMVLAADHLIRDVDGFRATVAAAVPAAEAGHIVVFGIAPDRPATDYGYIRAGAPLPDMAGRRVAAFIEKPDAATATAMVAEGCLWNSGMFLMKAGTMLAELEVHAADIAACTARAVPAERGRVVELDPDAFEACPQISIDYAVMQKTDRAAVVDAGFDWSDLGTWPAVWASNEADADGNVASGDVTLLGTKRSYVSAERQKIGVLGLEDAMVVATADAVLVAPMSAAAGVKDLATAVEAEPEKVIGDFIRHHRPWGNYQALDLGPSYQVKRLTVLPHKRLSLQKHRHRDEHWTVVEGTAEVTVGERVLDLGPNQSVNIRKGDVHRLANHGDRPLVVIEVQYGDYLGEDDIVRIDDDFGR